MSGCYADVTPPNGWEVTLCDATVYAGGLCVRHLAQRRDDTLMRQRIGTVCIADRLASVGGVLGEDEA